MRTGFASTWCGLDSIGSGCGSAPGLERGLSPSSHRPQFWWGGCFQLFCSIGCVMPRQRFGLDGAKREICRSVDGVALSIIRPLEQVLMRRRPPLQGSYHDEAFQSLGACLRSDYDGLADRLRRRLRRRCRAHHTNAHASTRSGTYAKSSAKSITQPCTCTCTCTTGRHTTWRAVCGLLRRRCHGQP